MLYIIRGICNAGVIRHKSYTRRTRQPSYAHKNMIRAHFYHNPEDALEGLTQQLFKHIKSTRFIIDPYYSIDDLFYQGIFPHTEEVLFSLAIASGETSKQLFTHWRRRHLKNDIWRTINYYWLDENHAPFTSPENNFGEAYRRFFRHTKINPHRIHPIRYDNTLEEEAKRYTSLLPSSRGLVYDPTRRYTKERPCVTAYKSNFHCAILDIDSNYHITSISPHKSTPCDSAKYNVTPHPASGEKRITAGMQILQKTPRIIVTLLGKEKAHIIEDLYYGRNTHLPAIQLLLEHPNVHIFTDNREMEITIYPNHQYVQTTPDDIKLRTPLDEL